MFSLKQHPNGIIVLLILFFISAIDSTAQNNDLERFDAGINVSLNSNKTVLHNYWKPGNVYGAYFKFHLSFALVQTGVSFVPFDSKNTIQPNFDGTFLYAQLEKVIFTIDNFTINAGVRFGFFRMVFESTSLYHTEDEMQEHEIFAGLVSSVNYKFTENLGINLDVNYSSILTRKKINLIFIGTGIYYSFNTPQWLKDFLK